MPDGHPYTVETMLGINDLRFAFPELEEVSFVKIDADTWTSCTWNGKRIKVWCFSRGDCSHSMTWEANIDIWIYLDATDFHMTGDAKLRVENAMISIVPPGREWTRHHPSYGGVFTANTTGGDGVTTSPCPVTWNPTSWISKSLWMIFRSICRL